MAKLDWLVSANLKPRHLHILVALDDLRSSSKAAERLCISQPAVSKSLGELEKGIGVKLFERNARGLQPTIYGECLVRHSRTVLKDLLLARDELSGLKSGTSGVVSVGALSPTVHSLLPQSLALLKQQSPYTKVVVHEGNKETLMAELWAGKLDLIVGRLPDDRNATGLEQIILSDETTALVSGPRHPLIGRKRLRWADLKGFSWVLPPPGTLLRRTVEQAFDRHNIPMPGNRIETTSVHLLCCYLQISHALAFMGSKVSEYYKDLGKISILPLEFPVLMRPVGVAWRRQQSLSPSTKLMIECLQEAAHTAKPGESALAISARPSGEDRKLAARH